MQVSGSSSLRHGLFIITIFQLIRMSAADHDETDCPWKLTNEEAIACKDDLRHVAECPFDDWLTCYSGAAEGCPDNLCTEAHRKKVILPVYKMAECVPQGADLCKDILSITCIQSTLGGRDNEFKLEPFTDPNQTLASHCSKLNESKTCLEDTLDGVTLYFGFAQTDACSANEAAVQAMLAIVNPIYTTFCSEGVLAESVCPNGGDLSDLPDVKTEHASTTDGHDHLHDTEKAGGNGSGSVHALIFMISASLLAAFINM